MAKAKAQAAEPEKEVVKEQVAEEKPKYVVESSADSPAEVVEIIGRVGTKQGGTQVRCKILAGREEGKIMRRNVLGPIRIGDVLILRESEIEASPTKGGRKG